MIYFYQSYTVSYALTYTVRVYYVLASGDQVKKCNVYMYDPLKK